MKGHKNAQVATLLRAHNQFEINGARMTQRDLITTQLTFAVDALREFNRFTVAHDGARVPTETENLVC